MPGRPSKSQIRRRRATAVLVVGLACLIVAGYAFVSSRGGINHPADWFTNTHGIDRKHETVESKAVGRAMAVEVLLPKGYSKDAKPPLLVFLHGRGTSSEHLSNSAVTAALAEAGNRAPVVALPYGEEASYWHDRADGDWDKYVTREVIPQIARKYRTDRDRVAIGGISMGGYGAYNIARLHPGRFCAVGGHSPAFWQTGGETAAGAFDDADDFARNDVVAATRNNASAFSGTKLWIDAGDEDPFQPGVRAAVSALQTAGADITAKTWPGGHDESYWEAHWPDYMKFYTRALAHCQN